MITLFKAIKKTFSLTQETFYIFKFVAQKNTFTKLKFKLNHSGYLPTFFLDRHG